ncbi:MAG: ATP-binding cassette domain-containing protein [Planctomycetes bacterium]|nr:ATP-binding cassette domain-containing protein [Planctomycetota bacterium]MCB9871935.1 ATP-binding cassette domain-containing protein [Planctomycetota bacterium]
MTTSETPKVGERVVEDVIRTIALSTTLGGRTVLDGIDIAIPRGEVCVILGPSGCGKTTLMRHLCGLLPPSRGSVFVEGRDLYELPEAELDALRTQMGLSFQGGALLGNLTVAQNVALPLRENTTLDEQLIDLVVQMKLDMVGMWPAADFYPASLSGGMRKRAAIARAIALDPQVVFLDEPSAGLDPSTAAGLDNLIVKLNRVFGMTVVVITHDLDSAKAIADRAILLMHGNVVAFGDREVVWGHPDDEVQAFLERRVPTERECKPDIHALTEH